MIPSVGPDADRELTDGAIYYAREADADLGFAFIEEFERALELLCAYPQLGAPWRGRRRFPLRRFPYSIIYYVMDENLRVIAIAHHRRRPGYWTGRE
ncbi:MAG: type II toxin-antitoxin system RelE/ParE family toxin [Burkholderiales bacterium]